jgi:ABC-2 type transport system permease protein
VTDTLRAEWVKTWSVRSTGWLLAGLVVATVAVSVPVMLAASCPAAACTADPAKLSLTGVYLGQVVAAITGVLAIGNEYGTGLIRVSLTAMPRRLTLLAAKTMMLAGPVLVASVLAVAGCMVAGWLILPGHGFTGFGPGDAADWRAALESVMDLTLIALLAHGVTTVVRESAVGAGAVLGLLFVLPAVIPVVGNATLIRHLVQASPLLAWQYTEATIRQSDPPLSPWPALGVVALWAAGALLLAALVFRRRDA